jgi:hypothetical protein
LLDDDIYFVYRDENWRWIWKGLEGCI